MQVSNNKVICAVLFTICLHVTVAFPGHQGAFLASSHIGGGAGFEANNAPKKISVEYGVADAHTGDKKSLSETRDGDNVRGQYSVLDADGSTRTVHYTADKHNGFNAQVTRDGHLVGGAAPAQGLHHAQLQQGAPLAYAASQGHGQGYTKVSRH
ncbi:hypothetical protein B566_EDAN008376 [Ephemera danica]|nr:hypothetical protein B566_EDAN008376 [Ephemera danica]